MNIVSRLKQYMDYIGMPSTQFADVAKVSRPTISQILNGRNRKISNELIEKIHAAFPALNIMWLLFGDGDIEIKTNMQTSEHLTGQKSLFEQSQLLEEEPHAQQQTAQFTSPMPLRTSNIEEFVEDNSSSKMKETENPDQMADFQKIAATSNQNSQRKIKSIMVFYNDSSFEIFTPSL